METWIADQALGYDKSFSFCEDAFSALSQPFSGFLQLPVLVNDGCLHLSERMNKLNLAKSLGSDDKPWPTWKTAAAIGLPVGLLSVGAYLYMNRKPVGADAVRNEPEGSATALSTPEKEIVPAEPVKGDLPKVEKSPEEIVKEMITQCQEMKNEGNKLFKQGKYSDAIEKYTQAIVNCPETAKNDLSTFHQNKAAALEKQENWESVIAECDKAIELNHRYTKAFLRRSKAHEKLGHKELCLEDITTVCLLENFANSSNMLFADQILKKIGFERAGQTYKKRESRLASAIFIKQYFNGFQEDVTCVPLTDEERGEHGESGYVRAKMAWEAGEYDKVIDECTAEIQASDAPPEASTDAKPGSEVVRRDRLARSLLIRATFNLLKMNNEVAKKDLDRLIAISDAHPKLRANALIKRGSMMMQMQLTDQAEADHNLAAEIDPANADIYHHRGQYYIIMNKVEAALKDFDKCIEIRPDYSLAHAQRCYTKYRQAFASGDVMRAELASAEFREIINKYPNCSETYGLYAQAEADRRNFDSADKLFQKALEIEPDNASLYVHRGTLMLQWKQDVTKAIEIISKALQIDPECDFAHEMLATIQVQKQNLKQALVHFDAAISNSRTEAEMAHLHSLRAAAIAQTSIHDKYGITTPSLSSIPPHAASAAPQTI